MRDRFTAGVLATTLGAGLFAAGAPGAHAGSKGRKNTALGLGALAAYQLLKGKTSNGLIAGAGAYYAYTRYKDARDDEKRRSRYYGRDDYRQSSYGARDRYRDYDTYGTSNRYDDIRRDDRYDRDGYRYGNYDANGRDYYRSRTSSEYRDARGRRTSYGTRYSAKPRTRTTVYRRTASKESSYRPAGWSRGRKTGWNGQSVPPGHAKKR